MRVKTTVAAAGLPIWGCAALVLLAACGDDKASSGAGGSGPGGSGLGGTGLAGTGGEGQTGGAGGSAPKQPAWQWTVACLDGHDPADPIDYGRCALDQALAEAHATRTIVVATIADPRVGSVAASVDPLLDPRAESYAIVASAGTTWVVGRDDIGAMYGALELAERVRLSGAAAVPPAVAVRGAPTVQVR